MRNSPNALFARGVERAVYAFARKSICPLARDHDRLDGKSYSIDEFYEAMLPYFDRPADFYARYDSLQELREKPAPKASFRRYEFPTPLPSGWECNDVASFKWFRGNRPSRSVLLLAPGWARVDQRIEELVCRRMTRQGVDMVLLMAPFHQSRAPAGSKSGEYFISQNIFLTIANFRQFVAEICQLVRYMRAHYDRVGLIGLSSGGFQAGLASLAEPVDFLFPVMTGCELGKITWTSLLTRHIRAALEAMGLSEAALSKAWAITDMAVVGRHSQARYCKQYLTRFDGIIPLVHQERLWEVYGRPDRVMLDASHYSVVFYLNRIADDITAIVARAG